MIKTLKKYLKYAAALAGRRRYPQDYTGLRFRFTTVVHYLTWRCNSRCITCQSWQTPSADAAREVWNAAAVRKLYTTLHTERVHLTGGEPASLPHFAQIVIAINEANGACVDVVTNALLPDKLKEDVRFLQKRKAKFTLALSCNGFERNHDLSRGVPGAYQKVTGLVDCLRSPGREVSLLFTLFPFNLDEAVDFVRFWRAQGVDVVLGIGRADQRYQLDKEAQRRLLFTGEEYARLETVLARLVALHPKYVIEYYFIRALNRGKAVFPCLGLYKRLVLDPYGGVYPCDGLPQQLYLGDLQEAGFDFDRFLQNNGKRIREVFSRIRDRGCQPCGYTCDLLQGVLACTPRMELFWAFCSKGRGHGRRYP